MISKDDALKIIQLLKKESPKRNFVQSVDVIINLKNINLKNPEEKVDFFLHLPHDVRDSKICAFVGAELLDQAKKYCDFVIHIDEFDKYKNNKSLLRKLAKSYDFFIAQANIMPKVASVFGRVLGVRGKMPNPKIGGIIPPKGDLKNIKDKFNKTVRIRAKDNPVIHVKIGKENYEDEILAENLHSLIEQVVHHLPKEKNNIKSIYIKTTMGKPLKVI